MKQTVTAKLQILVQPSDKQLICDTMKAYSQACNYVSDYIFKTHDLSYSSLQRHLYYEIRTRFGLKSQMAISCIRTVVSKYKTILTNHKKWIKPEFKRHQLDLVWNRDYSLDKSKEVFSVNTIGGRVKNVKYCSQGYEQHFSKDCKFGTAKVVIKHGRIFLHIPITFDIDILSLKDVTNVTGIDRGIRFIVVAYDSFGKTVFISGKQIVEKRIHYKKLRAELQKVGTPSSRRRLKAIGQRENRWMNDVNHCISKALVVNNPEGTLFILEDLSHINDTVTTVNWKDTYVRVSWSFYDLEQKLIYKALMHNQLVKKVNPAYTSQKCPHCGHTEESNRNKKIHVFCCKNCGFQTNDDRVGAMNLHQKGILLVRGE